MGHSCALRKAASLVIALAVVLGAIGHARAAAEMALAMPTAAMAAMPDGMDCDGGGTDKAKHATCVATCAVASALYEATFVLPVAVTVAESLLFAELPLAGHGPAPEPHPPKR